MENHYPTKISFREYRRPDSGKNQTRNLYCWLGADQRTRKKIWSMQSENWSICGDLSDGEGKMNLSVKISKEKSPPSISHSVCGYQERQSSSLLQGQATIWHQTLRCQSKLVLVPVQTGIFEQIWLSWLITYTC